MTSALRRAWDRLSLYLPVLLMGLLAMGTWWLVRNAPQPQEQRTASPPRHEADYQMRDFAVRSFAADGRLKSVVQGSEVRHYPDTDTLEIEQVRLRAQGKDGRITRATARRAISNADGSEVQLMGDAVVVREPLIAGGKTQSGLEFRGEFLHAWTQQERVRSHLPVTLLRGQDRITADSLDYDNTAQILQLHGRVRGLLVPTR